MHFISLSSSHPFICNLNQISSHIHPSRVNIQNLQYCTRIILPLGRDVDKNKICFSN